MPLLTELVSAHAVKLSSIENASLKQATIFNPILNQQLCAAPDPGACFAQHVKYCASKTPYCTARDGRLDPFTGEVFLSITDIKHSLACIKGSGGALSTNPEHYASPVTLLIEYKEVSIDAKGDQKRGVYYLTERYAHGDSHTRPIVYDPDAYATAEGARSSFEAHAKGFALDKKGCGTFRRCNPRTNCSESTWTSRSRRSTLAIPAPESRNPSRPRSCASVDGCTCAADSTTRAQEHPSYPRRPSHDFARRSQARDRRGAGRRTIRCHHRRSAL